MKNKRFKILIIVVALIFIITCALSFYAFFNKKDIDVESLQTELLNNNITDLREMDVQEVAELFGFYKTDLTDSIFLIGDYDETEEESIIPKEMVIFIKKGDLEETDFDSYYTLVKSMQESIKTNEESEEIKDLYSDVKTSKTDDYFYLIIGKTSDELLEIIKKYI